MIANNACTSIPGTYCAEYKKSVLVYAIGPLYLYAPTSLKNGPVHQASLLSQCFWSKIMSTLRANCSCAALLSPPVQCINLPHILHVQYIHGNCAFPKPRPIRKKSLISLPLQKIPVYSYVCACSWNLKSVAICIPRNETTSLDRFASCNTSFSIFFLVSSIPSIQGRPLSSGTSF